MLPVGWCLTLALVVACSTASLRAQTLELPAEPVAFGAAFELVAVVAADVVADGVSDGAFDEAQLAPLVVEELARELTPAGLRLRFRARCYELGNVSLAVKPARTLRVTTCLPDPPGQLEWPSDGYEWRREPVRHWLTYGLIAIAVLFAFSWWRSRKLLPSAVHQESAGDGASWDAVAALQALALPVTSESAEAFYTGIKDILRRSCVQQFALPAFVRTSEELVASVASHSSPSHSSSSNNSPNHSAASDRAAGSRAALQPCLQTCDQALFSQLPIAARHHVETRDLAVAFVQSHKVSP